MLTPERRLRALLLLVALSAAPLSAEERPGVDDVISRHIEARGGYEALAAIRTLVRSEGLYREPGYEGSGQAFMAHARPYHKVVGNPESPGGFMEGYDGAAWEWFAEPGVVIRTVGEAAAAARHGAYLDGPLVDYRERGSTAELGELTPIGERQAWRVTLTARDGFRMDYFIDAETWLVIAERMAAPIHAWGAPVARETRVGDYRRVGGVLFPHHFTETDLATGRMVSEMRWGRLEVDRDLPRWWFSPPPYPGRPAERSLLATFLEHLFFERADGDAVMWTYADFRRVHAEVDTREGVELIGYQMLKMGDTRAALRLLEANAADHPHEASAAFSLGRAQAAAGRLEEARVSFERALELDPDHDRAGQALRSLD
jgi:hypothetical protein